ncbi:hypothetical protein TNCV_1055301 [Trichonephila clavipes]|nr:hypothetical protein TNCV_1055301 [Trichonephila clavipes]
MSTEIGPWINRRELSGWMSHDFAFIKLMVVSGCAIFQENSCSPHVQQPRSSDEYDTSGGASSSTRQTSTSSANRRTLSLDRLNVYQSLYKEICDIKNQTHESDFTMQATS